MPEQRQQLTASQKLAQKQTITQKLIQSISLMAMPLTELQETIREEVEKNPALEIIREAGEVDSPDRDENVNRENGVIEQDFFSDISDPGYQPVSPGDSDSKRLFLEGAVTREKTLHEILIDQLHLMNTLPELADLTENIIWNLNGDGFHNEPPDMLLTSDNPELLESALRLVRSMEPVGCACRDWQESLLVQAEIKGDSPPNFERFVREGLGLLKKRRPEDVRAKLRISLDDWKLCETYVRTLSPFPGRLYSVDTPQYIVPDLIIRKEEGELTLILNDEILPVLRINPDFEKIGEESGIDRDARRFVSDHSREARYFINSLAQRDNTLLKTARSIVEFQRDFFSGGPRFLRPLTLKEVADTIGVHETTVSRITTNKYAQTDWGLFRLKFFFTNSISGSGDAKSRISKVAAKEAIKEVMAGLDANERISDQALSELLAGKGINLARRTVAKYRNELDLPSSHRQ